MAPSCLLLLCLLHGSAALKIFSPSSVGTRYFDNSQIGIITTDRESDVSICSVCYYLLLV
jgi:hypothetical protein